MRHGMGGGFTTVWVGVGGGVGDVFAEAVGAWFVPLTDVPLLFTLALGAALGLGVASAGAASCGGIGSRQG